MPYPTADCIRCIVVEQLGNHRGWRQNLIKEFRKEIDLADQDQVTERQDIGDGFYCLEESRMAAMLRSRSSIV